MHNRGKRYEEKNYRWGERFPQGYSETAPVLHSSYYDELTDRQGFLFAYNYNTRTNAILTTCEVPLYAKLFKPVTIPVPTRKVYKEINYLNNFINFVKHPVTDFMIGVFLVTNVILLAKSVLLNPAPLIGASVFYASTHFFSNFSAIKIKALTAKVDKIISEIKEDDPDISYEELYKLENKNRIFFSYRFPGNHALLFKYFFLEGMLMSLPGGSPGGAETCFERALEVATNEKDEFICIRRIINLLYKQYSKSNEVSCKGYPEQIKRYIDQVPANQAFHAEVTKKLSQGLHECYDLVEQDNVIGAYKRFAELEFDAFTDELYPHLSIMYYQLEAALTLSGKHFKKDSNLFTRDEERLTIARHSLLKVQWYIDTYYPEESIAHRKYVLKFEDFWELLPVIKHLHDPDLLGVYDGRRVKTIVEPVEKEIPNKHVKIEFEPLKLSM